MRCAVTPGEGLWRAHAYRPSYGHAAYGSWTSCWGVDVPLHFQLVWLVDREIGHGWIAHTVRVCGAL